MARTYAPRSAHPDGECPRNFDTYPAPYAHVPRLSLSKGPAWIEQAAADESARRGRNYANAMRTGTDWAENPPLADTRPALVQSRIAKFLNGA